MSVIAVIIKRIQAKVQNMAFHKDPKLTILRLTVY